MFAKDSDRFRGGGQAPLILGKNSRNDRREKKSGVQVNQPPPTHCLAQGLDLPLKDAMPSTGWKVIYPMVSSLFTFLTTQPWCFKIIKIEIKIEIIHRLTITK